MIPISVCIIAKNEEKNIDRCLKLLSAYPFELVVVDTGSTDSTREVAKNYTDRIYEFDWCDDFSAARNFSLEKASNDWILVVDCDEYLETIRLEETYALMQNYPHAVGQIVRHSSCYNGTEKTMITDYTERLFDKRLYHYEGIIHEQLAPRRSSADSPVLSVYRLPMEFSHDGYDGTPEKMQEKALRNITLLLRELGKHPDDPYLYYQLGESYSLTGDWENAYQAYDKGFYLDVDESLPYVKIMITSYGYSMLETNRAEKALGLEGVYDNFKTYADFVCMMGCVYLALTMNRQALEQFLYAATLTDYMTEGANSFIPFHNIGCIYEAYGYYKEALFYYDKAAKLGYTASMERKKNLEANHAST